MSSISIKWKGAGSAGDKYGDHKRELSEALSVTKSVCSNRCMRGGNFNHIYNALNKIIDKLEDEKNDINSLQDGLTEILRTYQSCENELSGQMGEKALALMLEAVDISYLYHNIDGKTVTQWAKDVVLGLLESIFGLAGGESSAVTEGTLIDWKDLIGLTDVFDVGDAANLIFSFLTNLIDNVEEFDGKGDIGRMLAELAIETGVDFGVGKFLTYAVTTIAGVSLTATGVVVVAWVGGLIANGICKLLNDGKDIGETFSDFVCDNPETVKNVWDIIKPGFGVVTQWGLSLLGFA